MTSWLGFPKNVPGSLLHEAYIEFVRDEKSVDGIHTYNENENVVLLRTFSKAHGMANLRVGYSVAHPQITENIRVVATPFAVSSVAEDAAVASLANIDQVLERVEGLVSERERVVAALSEQGWKILIHAGELRVAATGCEHRTVCRTGKRGGPVGARLR